MDRRDPERVHLPWIRKQCDVWCPVCIYICVCIYAAICKIIGNRAPDFNGFLYQFTTEKSLKAVASFPIILQSPVYTSRPAQLRAPKLRYSAGVCLKKIGIGSLEKLRRIYLVSIMLVVWTWHTTFLVRNFLPVCDLLEVCFIADSKLCCACVACMGCSNAVVEAGLSALTAMHARVTSKPVIKVPHWGAHCPPSRAVLQDSFGPETWQRCVLLFLDSAQSSGKWAFNEAHLPDCTKQISKNSAVTIFQKQSL